MRVLISRLSALGDVVCTLPVASAIKSQWPESEIVWVVDKRFRGVVDCCPAVDQVIERPQRPQEIKALGEFDAALDMQGLFKSGVLVGFANAKQKLGYHWQREGASLFSQKVLPDPTSIHIVDQYVDVARALGASCDRAEFNLQPHIEDVAAVQAKLQGKGWAGTQLVLCNAGAGWVTKRWNPAKYATLADRLHEKGVTVAFLGGPADQPVLEEVRAHGAHHAISMVAETNIRELVALASLANVHIGGDTGSTHLSASLDVPAVGIYTITKPERSCPYGQYENSFTGDPSVESIFEKTMAILGTQC